MHVLSALLASLLWGTADFLGGRAARRLPTTTVVATSQLVALLGLVPLAAAIGAYDEPRTYVLPGLAAGAAGVVALTAFYRALATGTMGVVAPIAALGVVVPVVVGLLDGEQPGPVRLVGIALGVVGVVLASGPELAGGGGGARPLLLAGLAGLGFGAVLVLLAQGSESGSTGAVVMTLLVMRAASVSLLAVVLLAAGLRAARLPAAIAVSGAGAPVGAAPAAGLLPRPGLRPPPGLPRPGLLRSDLPVLVAIGVFDVAANAAFALSSQGSLVSVSSVLASLYPVVTVLLARRFLAERLSGVQAVGVGASLGGVVLLAAG